MSDIEVEQKLVEFLTPAEVDVPAKMELDNYQLDSKINILKEQQDQIMHILKINYWNQIEEIVTQEHNNGSAFLAEIKSQVNDNLYHHLSNIYSLRKMYAEYNYIRRNNLEYATV